MDEEPKEPTSNDQKWDEIEKSLKQIVSVSTGSAKLKFQKRLDEIIEIRKKSKKD